MAQRRPTQRIPWFVWVILIVLIAAGVILSRSNIVGGQDSDGPTLTISAAANVQPAFEELGARFTDETGIPLVFNFGSSGQLTQQIEADAPVDVFASADVGYVDDLAGQGLVLPATQVIYARGQLVLWAGSAAGTPVTDLQQLTSDAVQRVAIANPDHAPYGRAAREALQTAGIWDEIQPKLVLGESVRDAQQYAATGNVDVALIPYALVIEDDGPVTFVPDDRYEPIDQAMAVVSRTEHENEARRFVEFVTGPVGREVLEAYGYGLPGQE